LWKKPAPSVQLWVAEGEVNCKGRLLPKCNRKLGVLITFHTLRQRQDSSARVVEAKQFFDGSVAKQYKFYANARSVRG
jgi:hypothetical protein